MNMKFVSVRVEGELYKKLVEYAMEKCTIFSFIKTKCRSHSKKI